MTPPTEMLVQAQRRHRAGDLEAAEPLYRQFLQAEPGHAQVWYLLGAVCHGRGKLPEAVAGFQRALALQAEHVEARHHLGVTLAALGRLAEAVDCYRETLRRNPGHAEAHRNLGLTLMEQGQSQEAVRSLRQALALRPGWADACRSLGLAYRQQGAFEEALAAFREALGLRPDYAEVHNHIGNVLREQGKLEEAEACYREALRLKPDYPEAHNNLGVARSERRELEEAGACYRRALRLRPAYPQAHANLGQALVEQGKVGEAAEHLQEALRLRPNTRLRVMLATLVPPLYQSMEELREWRQRLTDNVGRLRQEGVTLDVTRETAPLVFYLAYQGCNDRAIHRELARLYVAPAAPAPLAPSRRGRRIRVGFLSRFFGNHTIGELMRGVIAGLSRQAFEVTVLSLGSPEDQTGRFIQQHADRYVALPLDLPAARRAIAGQGLDVLFYTDIGMDPYTYTLALSRLAPVQCTTWGHPVTTGIPAMDYFLSSALFEGEGAEEHYTERLVRLPALPCYCFRPAPPAAWKGRDHFGLPEAAHVYACPQSLFKMHPEFDAFLGGILRRDPRGLLVLNRPHRAHYQHWEQLLQARFAHTLADVVDRVRFLPRLSHDDYLSLNALSDVLLDPIHFNGGNTSLKGLALGTPIVTLPSELLRGRLTAALYERMGVRDGVVHSPEEYVDVAVRLGTEPDYRQAVRAKIRAAHGVLYDNPEGVRALEQFFQQVVAGMG